MAALWLWFNLLPPIVRRLMGAVLICGAIAVAILAYGHHRESKGYAAGYGRAADSVNAIAIARIAARETVYVHDAQHADSQVVAVSQGHPVQHLVIEPQPVPVTVPVQEPTVRVIVEAVHDTVDNVPLRAAKYWQQADSTAGLAIRAAGYWHAAYLNADSVATLYADRLRNAVALPAASHRTRDVAFATLGIVAGFVAARHIR